MDGNLRKLIEKYQGAINTSTKPEYIRKLPSHHIEDEEKSVKWNKKFIEENNKKYLETVSELQRKRSFEINRVQKEIENYIKRETRTSEKVARYIFNFANEEKHAYSIYEVGDYIDKLINFINECKEIYNNGND